MNLPSLGLFCCCCCCWLHSTRWSGLKSVNTAWPNGMETSLDILWPVRKMKMNAIIGDGRNWQYTGDTRSLFKPYCGIYSANFERFLFQRYQKKCYILYWVLSLVNEFPVKSLKTLFWTWLPLLRSPKQSWYSSYLVLVAINWIEWWWSGNFLFF